MYAIGIREIQKALSKNGDDLQREFVALSEKLAEVGRKLLEVRGVEAETLRNEQAALREKQQAFAEEVNQWRDRAKAVVQQRSSEELKVFLTGLLPEVDPPLRSMINRILQLMDTPEEELAKMEVDQIQPAALTAAGKLMDRARSSYDLRSSDSSERQRAAVEFANRPGMALNDEVVSEIEDAFSDSDPLVREVAFLTAIQLHRFRALRVAELSIAHESVKRLAALQNAAVIPALIEIAQKPRSGFIPGEGAMTEASNARSRMVALLRLVEWHTPEAQAAVRKLCFDQDKHISDAAKRALELFPDPWVGPLKSPQPRSNPA